jgi:hypothetical protein
MGLNGHVVEFTNFAINGEKFMFPHVLGPLMDFAPELTPEFMGHIGDYLNMRNAPFEAITVREQEKKTAIRKWRSKADPRQPSTPEEQARCRGGD